jgi:hypothetical protein
VVDREMVRGAYPPRGARSLNIKSPLVKKLFDGLEEKRVISRPIAKFQ